MNSPANHRRRLPPVYELTGPETLARLRSAPMKQCIRSIAVVDSRLPDDQARALERQLNRWYFACGCEQGSLAVLLTLLTSVAGGLRAGFDGALAWWCIVGYVMVAAFVGKVLGLLYAKARLRGLYRRLDAHYRCGQHEKRPLMGLVGGVEASAAEARTGPALDFFKPSAGARPKREGLLPQ
ncbi:MAG: hypothetical protein HYZ17_16600 [Betaproteobacteria bacterium]|nr:hypothetical protein [Betaproteobacteria bacterium]